MSWKRPPIFLALCFLTAGSLSIQAEDPNAVPPDRCSPWTFAEALEQLGFYPHDALLDLASCDSLFS